MKKLIQIGLLLAAILGADKAIYAQQMSTIAQLREQIKQFELVARDANTPNPVKSVNESFLATRRMQLRTLLQYQVDSLRKYQMNYQSHFSAKESQVVADSIRSLELEIANVAESSHQSAVKSNSGPFTGMQPVRSAPGATITPGNANAALVPQTQVAVIRKQPTAFTDLNAPVTYATLDLPNAAIFNSTDASRIIKEAIAKGILSVPPPYYASGEFSDNFNCVIHVLRWANPSKATDATGQQEDALTVAAQNWYVFNNGRAKGTGNRKWSNEDFATLNRVFGVKKVWLLFIHLNRAPGYEYAQARYDFNIQKKTAANVNNLLSVAQLFITLPAASGVGPDGKPLKPQNLWGGDQVDIEYVPSDITVTANFVKTVENGPVVNIDKPKKFDNEGRYWWDVSVAVPVRHISQTQFDTSANTVTAKEVDKQNAFALLNLYPVPVDIKGSNFTWIPHFVGGVAIAKQPLKKFLLGAGFGPSFANFYVGAVFTEEKEPATLKEGDTATPEQLNSDLRKHFKPKFSFGFNLPVRGVIEALKKKE